MSDTSDRDGSTHRLDAALAGLRRAEPDATLRRDVVWSRVEAARAEAARVEAARALPRATPLFRGPSRRWAAAAAVTLLAGGAVAGGALATGRWSARGTAHADAADPLLADAARVLRALPAASAAAADSLQGRSALLLAATRAAADRGPTTPARARLLHDVEYVLAQVVEGGLTDDVERELTLGAIRDRGVLARIDQAGAE